MPSWQAQTPLPHRHPNPLGPAPAVADAAATGWKLRALELLLWDGSSGAELPIVRAERGAGCSREGWGMLGARMGAGWAKWGTGPYRGTRAKHRPPALALGQRH